MWQHWPQSGLRRVRQQVPRPWGLVEQGEARDHREGTGSRQSGGANAGSHVELRGLFPLRGCPAALRLPGFQPEGGLASGHLSAQRSPAAGHLTVGPSSGPAGVDSEGLPETPLPSLKPFKPSLLKLRPREGAAGRW